MNTWRDEVSSSSVPDPKPLACKDGELISIRIRVEPRLLEDLLELLAELPYPINPQIRHYPSERAESEVEFPAYHSWLPRVRESVDAAGLGSRIEVISMLAAIQADGV